jgi:N6-adenosine-specific RNA methylase IME4
VVSCIVDCKSTRWVTARSIEVGEVCCSCGLEVTVEIAVAVRDEAGAKLAQALGPWLRHAQGHLHDDR